MNHINCLVRESDITCVEQLRMDQRSFMTLYNMVHTIGGLGHSKYVTLEEKVAFFLFILAQHLKIRNVKFNFYRFRETVSRHFNNVLKAMLRLQANLLVTPNPITKASTDPRWNCFQHSMAPILKFVYLWFIKQGIRQENERLLLMFWEFALET
ncbi:hypothetical protein ACSBR2_008513 [Camellia fascicularis]